MMQLDNKMASVFNALGDPARIEMVRRLSSGQPHPISAVSMGLGITRQGARKHLQVLVDARMVSLEPKGRDVYVHLAPETLDLAKAFIVEIERRWDMRLDALRRFVEDAPDESDKRPVKVKQKRKSGSK
jgi:DNA-binding transcriptional ArsR family regulator